jgi:hypothetical protein
METFMSERSPGEKAGMSTLDLMNSSPAVNRIVKIMLRKQKLTLAQLMDELGQLPPEKRLSDEAIKQALAELEEREWLFQDIDNGEVCYHVGLRPKLSSAEQLRTDNSHLPALDLPADQRHDPKLKPPEVRATTETPAVRLPEKKSGLFDTLSNLFKTRK